MYVNHTLNFELAQAKQRDMLVQAENYRRARQGRQEAQATQASASRRPRRAWQLLKPLRPQAQS